MYKSLPIRSLIITTVLLASTAVMATESVDSSCPDSVEVPAALKPSDDQSLAFKLAATGVQIYACTLKASGEYSWLFIAPSANLHEGDETLLGTHSIGPVWQDNDGSLVKGAKVAEAPSPEGSIPWLLLKSVSNTGEGRFSKVLSIQRLNTTGGLAPAVTDCNETTLATIKPVPYTADYYFFELKSNSAGSAQK